jgi:alkylation response protein AidB-like acyl-CoA dehydrogenase
MLDPSAMDASFLRPANLVEVLFTLAAPCAGVGSSAAFLLIGELLRRRHAPALPSDGFVAVAFWEEDDFDLARGMPHFACSVADGAVDGKKTAVFLAPRATLFAVWARGASGPELAWVESRSVAASAPLGLLGIRAVRAADIELEAARVICSTKVEMHDVLHYAALSALFTSACACASAEVAILEAWEYAGQRYQGGGMIERYDAVAAMYGKNVAALETSRRAILHAAESWSDDDPNTWRDCLRIKLQVTDATRAAASDAIQIHGGYGYMRDYKVEKRFRDIVTLSLIPLDNTRLALMLAR